MPTAQYSVYVSNTTLIAEIAEYCEENDLSEAEFFRQAAGELIESEA